MTLLLPSEPPAVEVVNATGCGDFFLICDHASPRVPARLGDLGLCQEDRLLHIGWDIGAQALARRLSVLLSAPLVLSGYSRLVIDCNRPLDAKSSVPATSGGILIPGNAAISPAEAAERAAACFWPYHDQIRRLLDQRRAAGRRTVLLSLHTFTPRLLGQERPWTVALLYMKERERSRRTAGLFIQALRRDPSLVVGDNQPYQITEGGDYGIPIHGEGRDLPCALIEVRQDGVATEEGADAWARRLHAACAAVLPLL